ncbi:MAG: outer membrane protein assembly factor BamD, partial [Phycisphaerales bacterium]
AILLLHRPAPTPRETPRMPTSTPRPIARLLLPAMALLAAATAPALSQASEFQLDESGDWTQTQAPEPGSDAAIMAEATALIAEGEPGKAHDILSDWLDEHKRTRNEHIAQAYYLRGVARLERQREYKALFDFEAIIRDYPSSPFFLKAVEHEYNIGLDYINGLRRRFLGFRFENARPTGEELLIRTQERVPGSQLAEEAAMQLADHYYNRRELKLAAEMYAIFRRNYPDSPRVERAMLREIESNIARFKGPRYDGSGLLDAKLLIEQYQRDYPASSLRAGITEGLDAWIDESAALQALDTARWYLKVNDEPSARFVLARLIPRHPATDAADEALDLMIERGWIEFDSQPTVDPTTATDAEPSSDGEQADPADQDQEHAPEQTP